MPSPPSTRPSDARGRRSSAFVHERHAHIDARGHQWPLALDVERAFHPLTFSRKGKMTEETIPMKAIVVTDQAAGTAGMTLVERPEPRAAINDVVVQVHASGFVGTELGGASTSSD